MRAFGLVACSRTLSGSSPIPAVLGVEDAAIAIQFRNLFSLLLGSMRFDPKRAEGVTDSSCGLAHRFSFHSGVLVRILTGVLLIVAPWLQLSLATYQVRRYIAVCPWLMCSLCADGQCQNNAAKQGAQAQEDHAEEADASC